MLTKVRLYTKAMLAVAAVVALPDLARGEDPVRGRAIAQQRCVACHNMDGGPRRPNRSAPSFSEIARQAAFNADQLTITLTYGHIPMGNGRVTAGEAGDLAAYIVSLRRR